MKFMLSLVLLGVVAAFSMPIVLGYVAVAPNNVPRSNAVLQVWFDACPQLTGSYPLGYLFNVAAKTSSGLWITTLHWDFGDNSTLNVPYSGQSQVSEIRAHQYANKANYIVTVTAYDNAGNTRAARVSLMPDFTLAPAFPTTQTVVPGGSTTYTVNVGSVWCKQIRVDLTTSLSQNPPSGVTWNLNPPYGNTSFTSTLQVNTETTTPKGNYAINIVGTGAGFTHTVTVALIVNVPAPPYFTLSVVPTSLSVPAQSNTQPDRTNTTTVVIQSFNGFNSAVTLTNSTPPKGMVLSFSQLTVTPPPNGQATSTLTIVTPCSVSPGPYGIIIQGGSGSNVRQANLNIMINACTVQSSILPLMLLVLGLGFLIVLPIFLILLRRRTALAVVPVVPVVPVVSPTLVPTVPVLVPPAPLCPTCGTPLILIKQYQRWYCNTCQE